MARRAGVDVSLVSYYFGSKERLFAEAVELPMSPREIVAAALDSPRERLGESLTRGMLAAWASEDARLAAQGVLQSLYPRDDFRQTLLAYADTHVIGPLSRVLGGDDAVRRATLAVTQLTGLAVARHVVGVESLAGVSQEELVAAVAPVVQHYLTGDLSGGPQAGGDVVLSGPGEAQ